MTSYLSGAEALADARLRFAAIPSNQGILMVEGRNDVRVFIRHVISATTLIPCGNKRKLLEAHALLRPGEDQHVVFVVDCDYDVPAGRLRPGGNLIVTEHVDVEADLIRLGLVERLVTELVPSALESEARKVAVTHAVVERSSALAEAIGKFRLLTASEDIRIRFHGLRYRRYRTQSAISADMEKLGATLHNSAENCTMTPIELVAAAEALPGGPKICHGKDMIGSVAAVLHDDFGVDMREVAGIPGMLRLAITDEAFARWGVSRRLAQWQRATGRYVLSGQVSNEVESTHND
jgi:hypothetical protein